VVTSPSASGTGGSGVTGRTFPLYYLDPNQRAGRVKRWDGPGIQPVDLPSAFVGNPLNANVSPDGHFGSYVDGNAVLHVVDLRTGQVVLTRNHVDPEAIEPVWAPDSHRLLIGDITKGPNDEEVGGVFDVTTRAFTPLQRLRPYHPTWSPDGTKIAYVEGGGTVFTADADGSNQQRVPGLGQPGPRSSFDVESIGPGGTYIALWIVYPGMTAGDIARGMKINAIVDSRTGQPQSLSGYGNVEQALFRTDGSMVLRVKDGGTHRILLAHGVIRDQVTEPASLSGWLLLNP
jgi:Tol biopolymer transport system component